MTHSRHSQIRQRRAERLTPRKDISLKASVEAIRLEPRVEITLIVMVFFLQDRLFGCR